MEESRKRIEFKMNVRKHLNYSINKITVSKEERKKYKILIVHLLNGRIFRYEYLFVKKDSISDKYEIIIDCIKPNSKIINGILESINIHHTVEHINNKIKYTLFFPVYFELPLYTNHENIFLNHLYKEYKDGKGDLEIECKNGKIKVHSLVIDSYGKEEKSVMLMNMISSNFKKESKLLFDVSLVEELMDLLYLPHKWRFNDEKDYYPILSLLNFLMLFPLLNNIFIHVFNNDPINASLMALEYFVFQYRERLFIPGIENQEKINKQIALDIMRERHKPFLSPLVNIVKFDSKGFISRASFSINGNKCCLYYNYHPRKKLNSFVLFLKNHTMIWTESLHFFRYPVDGYTSFADESFYCYKFKVEKNKNESYPEFPSDDINIREFEINIGYAKKCNELTYEFS